MYHPSYLSPKTILKIQTAQRSAVLPLDEHLRVNLQAAQSKVMNGAMLKDEAMRDEGNRLVDEYAEQLRILENITDEGREAYEEVTKFDDMRLNIALGIKRQYWDI